MGMGVSRNPKEFVAKFKPIPTLALSLKGRELGKLQPSTFRDRMHILIATPRQIR